MKKNLEIKVRCSVRLSHDAKDKLTIIAEQKNTSLSDATSKIIIHHAVNGYDYDISTPKQLTSIVQTLKTHSLVLNAIAGRTERSEDFIKGLLREDRLALPAYSNQNIEEVESSSESNNDHRLNIVLNMMDRFMASANKVPAIDGGYVMQIRLPILEFNQLKSEREKLCM